MKHFLNLFLMFAITFSACKKENEPEVAQNETTGWKQVGANNELFNGEVHSICSDSQGNLYAAGEIQNSDSKYYVAQWNGLHWKELGGDNALKANGPILSICANTNGDLYAAGIFTNGSSIADGKPYVAKWNGTNWAECGTLKDVIYLSAVIADKSGFVYVIGKFYINGVEVPSIAKWNGSAWENLYNSEIEVYGRKGICSDNQGNIFVLGSKKNLSINQNFLFKWDGKNWADLGSLYEGAFNTGLCSDIKGNIYAANYGVGKWDKKSWSKLGSNNSTDYYTLFWEAGMLYAIDYHSYKISKWDGQTWSNIESSFNAPINSICGNGNGDIYAAGLFSNANGKYYVANYSK